MMQAATKAAPKSELTGQFRESTESGGRPPSARLSPEHGARRAERLPAMLQVRPRFSPPGAPPCGYAEPEGPQQARGERVTPRYILLGTTHRPVPKVQTPRIPFGTLDRTAEKEPCILSRAFARRQGVFRRAGLWPKRREVECGARSTKGRPPRGLLNAAVPGRQAGLIGAFSVRLIRR